IRRRDRRARRRGGVRRSRCAAQAPGRPRDADPVCAAPRKERRPAGGRHRESREGAPRVSVTRVILPKLGLTMDEGRVIAWHKTEGERVAKGEILFEVETDKANMEIESPAAGIVRRILVPADATVPVTTLIALIADTAEEPLPEMADATSVVAEAAPASG